MWVTLIVAVGCGPKRVDVVSDHQLPDQTASEPIVLVGLVRTGKTAEIFPELKIRVNYMGSFSLGSGPVDVVAITVPPHEVYSISLVSRYNADGSTQGQARFREPAELLPTEIGIYYYGTVVVQDDQIHILSDPAHQISQGIIRLARQKHSQLFERMQPINFDSSRLHTTQRSVSGSARR